MAAKTAHSATRSKPSRAKPAAATRGSGTLTSMAHERLREDIIGARFESGQRLHIQQLCERYGMGLSPIREALNRLSRDGLVSQTDRRGFRVTPLSEKHLAELTRTRIWINELALRQSIAGGDLAWEEQVVLAYHRLTRIPRHVAGSSGAEYNPEWEKAHRAFHAALIAACGSRWLQDFCEQLFDAADCYRHLSRVSSVQRREMRQDEHKLIMDAALARDAEKAAELIRRHVVETADLVRDRLAALAKKDLN